MLYYHKCTRLLLQPQLYEAVINERFLKLCTEACIGICSTYRRLHDRSSVAFSTVSLQTIFIAGENTSRVMSSYWTAPKLTLLRSDVTVLHVASTFKLCHAKYVRFV